MEIIIVLTIGGFIFWLLYVKDGNPRPPLTEADIARMVPGQAVSPFFWLKYLGTFFVIFAATSWAGGISLLIAATACLILFWNDRS